MEFTTTQDYPPTRINLLLLQGQLPSDSTSFQTIPKLPTDSVLDASSFAQLKNYLLQASSVDTTLLQDVQALSDFAVNFPYTEDLILSLAVAQYQQNKVVDALRKLDRLQSVNVFKRNYYLNIIGLWALEQKTPRVATQYFAQLAEQNYQDARLKFAVSLTESLPAPDVSLAVVQQAWQDVLQDSTQSAFWDMANQQLRILSTPFAQMQNDIERYQWIRYRGQELTEQQIQLAFESFEDLSYAAVAAYDLLLSNRSAYSEVLTPIIQDLRENESSLNYQGTIYLEWAWALATISNDHVADWNKRINMLVPLTKQQQYQKQFWQALLAQSFGDDDKAHQLFSSLLGNPFFEPGLIGALHYFYAISPK